MSSDSDVDNVVKQYLLRKGYKKAADALTAERGALSLRQVAATVANDAQVVQQIALHDSAQYTPERYAQSYALFAGWVLSSLDMYKVPFPPARSFLEMTKTSRELARSGPRCDRDVSCRLTD